jgi:hypothetical protein
MIQGRWTGGGHVFFAKDNCNLSYIFIKKSYVTRMFVKSGLTPFLFRLHYFQIFFTVSKPKATNSRVGDGYLTQTQQFSVITWREQTNFK